MSQKDRTIPDSDVTELLTPKVPLPPDWCVCSHHANDHALRGACLKCPCDGFRSTEATTDRDIRSFSRCARFEGWHAYKAGPCFDTYEQAAAYRDSLDAEGVTWRSQ